MYKKLLEQTLPLYTGLDKDALTKKAGISTARMGEILNPCLADDVTEAEYVAIAKALPASITNSIKSLSEATEELEYLEQQLVSMAGVADDNELPMFNGMQRLVRRVIKLL